MKGIFFKIISFFIIFFGIYNLSYAETYSVSPKIKTLFSSFKEKLEKKYSEKKEILYLETINEKIQSFLNNKKLNSQKIKLLQDILVLSNEEIFKLNNKIKLQNTSQSFLEASIIGKLRRQLNNIPENNISKKFKNIQLIKIIKISNKQEFVENNKIKKLIYSKYFEINQKNYKYFINKKGFLLIKENGKIWFTENGKIEEKIPYSKAYNYTKGFIKYNKKYFKQNNIFYSYNFENFTYFEDKYGFYLSDFKQNKFDIKNTILYLTKNKRYNFIKNYTTTKLISSDIIYGITDKDIFLKHLVNDKLYLTDDTDSLFIKLKNEIKKLTKNKTKQEKIKIIYNFILEKITYTTKINLNDKKIFSGILAYKNSNGVCEGYAKLMSYALKFAGIPKASVIRGDVIDAQDFPKIGHAWVKIGDKYYDPTFDDPIGQKGTKKFSEYKYFGLPRDLFYANRFDYGVTPEALKTKSLNYRINFVNQRLSKLSDKYKGQNYLILRGTDFAKKNNIQVGKKIGIEEAKKIIPYYEVTEKTNGEIVFYKNGVKKNITKLQYFLVNNDNIEQVFIQKNYKTDGLYLFKWNKKNGTYEWRIGFDVVIK